VIEDKKSTVISFFLFAGIVAKVRIENLARKRVPQFEVCKNS
jgi:hypothetical protein